MPYGDDAASHIPQGDLIALGVAHDEYQSIKEFCIAKVSSSLVGKDLSPTYHKSYKI